ncbi:hypothetical protein D9615_000936 [Tricholomella constricta]|uniref:Signal recognition particle subunit SRP14 n=1 Tax=Tricholomella constricta TaxID=117010 RepID=A0A8H5HL70_9AGAR|nr:hypothetical protein D9615_000936 [Tricholomella constricta]
MQLVDNDTFLSQLTALFNASKDKGTIWLTHKRLSYDGEDAVMADAQASEDSREYPCLLRVTDGGSNKFSTQVEPGKLEKFHAAYGALLKASMTTLRKRDKKREKTRAEQAAQRKKKMTEPVVINGSKRGNGRRKRQRQVKAALRQQESQQKFKEREEAQRKA